MTTEPEPFQYSISEDQFFKEALTFFKLKHAVSNQEVYKIHYPIENESDILNVKANVKASILRDSDTTAILNMDYVHNDDVVLVKRVHFPIVVDVSQKLQKCRSEIFLGDLEDDTALSEEGTLSVDVSSEMDEVQSNSCKPFIELFSNSVENKYSAIKQQQIELSQAQQEQIQLWNRLNSQNPITSEDKKTLLSKFLTAKTRMKRLRQNIQNLQSSLEASYPFLNKEFTVTITKFF